MASSHSLLIAMQAGRKPRETKATIAKIADMMLGKVKAVNARNRTNEAIKNKKGVGEPEYRSFFEEEIEPCIWAIELRLPDV
jgi:hypothetical protein